MKLLIVRHGDPDYAVDSLTPVGWKEAELLSRRLSKLDTAAFYVSPLGRARDTAALTLQKTGRTAEELPWLREFAPKIQKPYEAEPHCCWDWLPEIWSSDPANYSMDTWADSPLFRAAGVREEARWVWDGLDALLLRHGYRREGACYRVEAASTDTIVLFCHFGVTCVMLSHLLHLSPMLLWHGTCAAPTSVTTLVTEERRKGIAHFRMTGFGDISHLYAAGQPPAFAARFCETYDSFDQRHD